MDVLAFRLLHQAIEGVSGEGKGDIPSHCWNNQNDTLNLLQRTA